MSSFQRNFHIHSVSNSYYRLSSIKEKLNTYFRDLQSKLNKKINHLKDHKKENLSYGNQNIFKALYKKRVNYEKFDCDNVESDLISLTKTVVSPEVSITAKQEKMTIDRLYLDLQEKYPFLNTEIRSILLARAKCGATISDIQDDYLKITDENFPITQNVTDYLLTIPNVYVHCNEMGARIFNLIPSEKNQHLYDIIVNQKDKADINCNTKSQKQKQQMHHQQQNGYNSRNNNRQWTNNNQSTWTDRSNHWEFNEKSKNNKNNNCFYEDNNNYLLHRFPSRDFYNSDANIIDYNTLNSNRLSNPSNSVHNSVDTHPNQYTLPYECQQQNLHQGSENSRSTFSTGTNNPPPFYDFIETNDLDSGAQIFDFLLLGDDFFLHFARTELKCRFTPGEKVLQSGLCVSGQTIAGAIKRISQMGCTSRYVIINIGSVDILQGRRLIQIEHDFKRLLTVLEQRGCIPILTTLAPLANYSHEPEIKQTLERFNEFIKRHAISCRIHLIDIWSCMVAAGQKTLFSCYQNQPRSVTGATEQYVFWNKIGRQRILQLIQSSLEY